LASKINIQNISSLILEPCPLKAFAASIYLQAKQQPSVLFASSNSSNSNNRNNSSRSKFYEFDSIMTFFKFSTSASKRVA